ncbi:Aryl hydrocarbon receptor nuclear translocator-like protein 1 [Portunus trituberculatus]|uniref:Aryl hydrocarbon receptor nuclear translocator-like protein 1 n=1 Tax=Portunus trituberculatus TaxID=210409 RepID=A0A5B7K3J2_PORTR|nr:Aryl hydrocarbon receptor nuclear translocator-like protein 1 [Portunus trituberculatus]
MVLTFPFHFLHSCGLHAYASLPTSHRDSNDDEGESIKIPRTSGEWSKRQNHSEIEKRRRDKMNTYIMELSSIIPVCTSRKLDKLTVLRMAVQHMKMLRGSLNSYTEGHYKPAFLSDDELKNLILQVCLYFILICMCVNAGSVG